MAPLQRTIFSICLNTFSNSYQTIQNAMCGNVAGITLAACELISASGEIIYPGTCGTNDNRFL